jgi:hypothetical protein
LRTTAIASTEGRERTLASESSITLRMWASSSSRAPNTTRRMMSSVSSRMRSSATTGPLQVASSERASSPTIGANARMRSP